MRQTGWMWALLGIALVILVAVLALAALNHRFNLPFAVPLAPARSSSP